jgi:antitoxin ParD1/3/4
MNISLTPDLAAIVETKVSSGRYESGDAVVREALRLLQEHERTDAEKLADLRREIALGLEELERGEGIEFDEAVVDEILQEARQERKRA